MKIVALQKEHYSKLSSKKLEAEANRMKWATLISFAVIVSAIFFRTSLSIGYTWLDVMILLFWLVFPLGGMMSYRWIQEELAVRQHENIENSIS